ncbi:Clp protease N-terminal domain-containing protein [Noviherbaspirillum sp.]|uniref:Clp protease N-terminal domain-containing protein n=1 Tax=Noviherbaspirillum sp. TaxID=1926288 RepID=UPI002FE3D6C5
MFAKIKQRFQDMHTIKTLCASAEKHANADGQKEPGAEHFVLAALELPDGTARKAFERMQTDPDDYRAAIARQYDDALRHVGIEIPEDHADGGAAIPAGAGIYKAQPSAQALMQQLANRQKADAGEPLLGAHVLLAVTAARHGVALRAFRAMGIQPAALADAAAAEIDVFAMN